MNGELLAVFEYLEKEKGISRDILIEAVSSSLISAARKKMGDIENLKVEIERETGDIKAYCELAVVERVQSPDREISLADAKKLDPKTKTGGTVRRYMPAKSFGRIAAQTAKQVIIQRIKEAENDIVFNEYKDRVGDVITSVVRRYERGNVLLDLGRAEAVLPPKEQCPREGYGVGRRFKVYIVEVKETPKGPEIVVSRSHPELLRKIFEIEVPEISEGLVEIKAVARDPGFRSKIAVHSSAEKVDAVGACVGMRGARVKNVVRELNGEKVDIVRWSDDPETYIMNTLSPATPRKVTILDGERAEVVVDDDQFSLAVGKKGQGARLISRLTGMKITVKKHSDIEREEREGGVPADQIPGLGGKALATLAGAGMTTVGDLRRATFEDLTKLPGIGEKTAVKIMKASAAFELAKKEEKTGETAGAAESAGEETAEAGGGQAPEEEPEAAGPERPEDSKESTGKKAPEEAPEEPEGAGEGAEKETAESGGEQSPEEELETSAGSGEPEDAEVSEEAPAGSESAEKREDEPGETPERPEGNREKVSGQNNE